ncbi:MAG TPA: ester cyclase, partial [Candidatus Bathyarchaeia archaeon]|nr:ester cyclase [Candidatus Bathyarchaeia archaeon]
RWLLRLYLEAKFGLEEPSVLDAVLSADFKEHDKSASRGKEEVKELRKNLMTAFSHQRLRALDAFRSDTKEVLRWTWRGVHSGRFAIWPPTNKLVKTSGITIAHMANGRITGVWEEWDFAGFREQLESK